MNDGDSRSQGLGVRGEISAGQLTISVCERLVTYRDRQIKLTDLEFGLLAYLASSPGVVHSQREIMDAVWDGGHSDDSSTVTVHVSRLRKKLGTRADGVEVIATVWGRGYSFGEPP